MATSMTETREHVERELRAELSKTIALHLLELDVDHDGMRGDFHVWLQCAECRTRFGERINIPNAVGPVLTLSPEVGQALVPEREPPSTPPKIIRHGESPDIRFVDAIDGAVHRAADHFVFLERAAWEAREVERRRRLQWVTASLLARLIPRACECMKRHVAAQKQPEPTHG